MNEHHAKLLSQAQIDAEDIRHEIMHTQRWRAAIYGAIQCAPAGSDDRDALVEIERHLIDRAFQSLSVDLESLENALEQVSVTEKVLNDLREVAA